MADPLILPKGESPEESQARILAHLKQVETERAAARAKADRDAEAEALAARMDKGLARGRQYSVHALQKLGRAGVEDILFQEIRRQVPETDRTRPGFERYQRQLVESVHELTRLYANGERDRAKIARAAGAVGTACHMVGIASPVKGVEGRTAEWQ